MSGVKGRSGRKPRHVEAMLNMLQEKSLRWVVDHFDSLNQSEKMKILTTIAPKMITQKTDINQTIEAKNKDESDNMYKALRRFNVEQSEN